MIRVGIVGGTGYGGRELIRLLAAHPEAELVAVASTSAAGQPLGVVLPAFAKTSNVVCEAFDAQALAKQCDVVFIGVPGTESMAPCAELRRAGVRVIDIGPDFRLKHEKTFREAYGVEHTAAHLLETAVYGLPAFYRDAIKSAALIAVPGCYPVSALVPLRPLVGAPLAKIPIVIDAISGISGAGRGLKESFHFSEMNENVWAYKVGKHQHVPEIEQELGFAFQVQFTPHVGPYSRGILTTITAHAEQEFDVAACYGVYHDEPFVRVLGEGILPELKYVRASNFCDFGWVFDKRTQNLVIISAVDNLTGGTAGMAIQCMNLMFGLDETTGLLFGGMAP